KLREYYIGMGHTVEELANKFSISKAEQHAFGAQNHERAEAAIKSGKFKDEIVPYEIVERVVGDDGKIVEDKKRFDTDEGVRSGTTPEILAKLRPEFSTTASETADNSSQMSDEPGYVLPMDREKAEAEGLIPQLKFRSFAVAGVPPEIMGVGPVEADPKALKLAGLEISDIGLFELNEAFASQSLHVINTLNLDPSIVNVNGGAIALGHPLGMTGTKLTLTIMHEMKRRNV